MMMFEKERRSKSCEIFPFFYSNSMYKTFRTFEQYNRDTVPLKEYKRDATIIYSTWILFLSVLPWVSCAQHWGGSQMCPQYSGYWAAETQVLKIPF